jgi:hypothetical protein
MSNASGYKSSPVIVTVIVAAAARPRDWQYLFGASSLFLASVAHGLETGIVRYDSVEGQRIVGASSTLNASTVQSFLEFEDAHAQ